MEALARDYRTVLLPDRKPPCLSLYQPTRRAYPDKQQNQIRYSNLVKKLELSLGRKYPGRKGAHLLRPFQDLARNSGFWNHVLNGVAVFSSANLFKAYRLQRPVKELAVVAESFHTKPLLRILQSADRYHVLGLNRQDAVLYEGNRDALDEIDLPPQFPRTASKVLGEKEGGPEQMNRVYGPAGPGRATRHGTDVRQEAVDREAERFFRAVDKAVLEQYFRPSSMPLVLAALPEHHHLFRSVSRNPYLVPAAIDVHPNATAIDELRDRVWELVLPRYHERLSGFIDQFGASREEGCSGADLAEVARAAAGGRVATLLIDADRLVPGFFDSETGAIKFASLEHPDVDDLLDDIGEKALKTGGQVVIVPAERMPTDTGLAAIYRF